MQHLLRSRHLQAKLRISLETADRRFFETRFNHNFATVRVYADRDSEALAHALDAPAYTRGSRSEQRSQDSTMSAPPVVRSLAKSAARTSDSSPLPRLPGLRTGDRKHERGRVPAARVSASGEPPRSHRNFAKIPVGAPERAQGPLPLARQPRAKKKKPAAPSPTITSETRVINPAPRTRTKIAVGEEVTLTYSAGNTNW